MYTVSNNMERSTYMMMGNQRKASNMDQGERWYKERPKDEGCP